jgi:hypothetical protein
MIPGGRLSFLGDWNALKANHDAGATPELPCFLAAL